MRPIRPTIVIVTNVYLPAIGGISTYVRGLTQTLRTRGYDVRIISFPMEMLMREDGIGNRIVKRLVHELFVTAFTFAVLSRILVLRFGRKPIIVHSQSASYCLGVGVLARLLGTSLVHTFHSPIEKCSSRLKVLLPFAPRLVFVSEEHRDMYARRCGAEGKSGVIPGGVDCRRYSPIGSNEQSNTVLDVANRLRLTGLHKPIVLFVGRVTQEKGVGVLLDAARIVLKEIGNAVFLVVGPYNLTKAQREMAEVLRREINQGMNFYLVGRMEPDELTKVYQVSDLMVCPSIGEEASPMVVVEAMASGLPIVASRTGGMKSRIVEGTNGRLVGPGDPSELARAITDMLSNPMELKRMGRESRGLAVTKYSVEAMADGYEKIYQEITEG